MGRRLRAGPGLADLLKIGELYLNEGRWRGRQIVSATWIQQATQEATPGYGYMWGRRVLNGHHKYVAMGSFGQLIVVVPDLRFVTAITSRMDPTYVIVSTSPIGPSTSTTTSPTSRTSSSSRS